MSKLVRSSLLATTPFLAAIIFCFIFVEVLGFSFVGFTNIYFSIITVLQLLVFLGAFFLSIEAGNKVGALMSVVLFCSMSLLVLAGLSAYQHLFGIALSADVHSVVGSYQHFLVRSINHALPHGQLAAISAQREVQAGVIAWLVSATLNTVFGGEERHAYA